MVSPAHFSFYLTNAFFVLLLLHCAVVLAWFCMARAPLGFGPQGRILKKLSSPLVPRAES